MGRCLGLNCHCFYYVNHLDFKGMCITLTQSSLYHTSKENTDNVGTLQTETKQCLKPRDNLNSSALH